MKKIIAFILVLMMLMSSGMAAALSCDAPFNWSCDLRPELNVVKYVRQNTESGWTFVACDCAGAILYENVYFGIELTVPADVEETWYNEAVLNSVKVDYENLGSNIVTEYFSLPAWEDVKGGGTWYLLNTATPSASATGVAGTASWTNTFNDATCIWQKAVSAITPKVTATIKSDSLRYNTYLSQGYTITIADGMGDSDVLRSVTFEQDSTGHKTVLNLDSEGKVVSADVTPYGDNSVSMTGISETGNGYVGYDSNGNSSTYDFNAVPGSILHNAMLVFNLSFSSAVTKESIIANFGWDDVISSVAVFDGTGATAMPVLEDDICYYDAPQLTLNNADELNGATFKIYRKQQDGTYVLDNNLVASLTGSTIDIVWLIPQTSGPSHLAISATSIGCGESEMVPFRMIDRDIPAPVLSRDYCYTTSPVLMISNYEELAALGDYSYRLYVSSDGGETYNYSEKMTKGLSVRTADALELKDTEADVLMTYPVKMAITAYVSSGAESELTEFELRKPEENVDYITDVLPTKPSDNNEENDSGNTSGAKPAEILIHGPVVRDNPDVAPGIEIIKHDDLKDLEGYEEMKGYINNNKKGYAYYEIKLENAKVKDDDTIEIRFYFGKEYENKKVWVLHLCSKHNDRLEKHEDLKVDEDGFVTIKVHAFSPFVIGFDNTPETPKNPASQSNGPSINVKYNGGNTFSTNYSAVPTSVEIDGVPVSFVGDGKSFTVDCIQPGTHTITVRWYTTSVTTNFTADASVVCVPNGLPKTGDVSVITYAMLSVITAAAVAFGKR